MGEIIDDGQQWISVSGRVYAALNAMATKKKIAPSEVISEAVGLLEMVEAWESRAKLSANLKLLDIQ